MTALIKYIMVLHDNVFGCDFNITCDSEVELRNKYEEYSKNKDYEVVSMQSVLLEIRPISPSIWDDKIM